VIPFIEKKIPINHCEQNMKKKCVKVKMKEKKKIHKHKKDAIVRKNSLQILIKNLKTIL
jgi:hypothetical protein